MHKRIPTFLVAALLLAPTACGTGGAEPEPAVTETVTAPATEPTPTEATAPETTEPVNTSEPAEPAETESETPSEEPSGEPIASPGDGEVLSFAGLGDFKLGDTDMVARGAMVLEPECNVHISAPPFAERGIHFEFDAAAEPNETSPLTKITIRRAEDGGDPVRTDAGAEPGMTYGEIRGLYPEATEETKDGDGGPFLTLSAREGDNEMVFLREDYSTAELDDAEIVEAITLRPYGQEMRGSC